MSKSKSASYTKLTKPKNSIFEIYAEESTVE